MKRTACFVLIAVLLTACMAPALAEMWNCGSCGAANDRKFCNMCGAPRPEKPVCAACGFELQPDKSYKFCPECGTKFAVPVTVTTPTPAPTAAPTATPAPVPAERNFYIDEITVLNGSSVRVHWMDSAAKGPYKVCYESLLDHDYDSAKQQSTVRWVGATDVAADSVELPYLVPGAPYWLTVFDADGVMAKVKFTPMERAPFTDYALAATLQPRMNLGTEFKDIDVYVGSDIMSDGESYGAYIRVEHEALKQDETYRAVVAITCPDGTAFVESVSDITLDAGSTSTYWNYYEMDGVFSKLIQSYGSIPAGEYTWALYLNGLSATSATFTVK